MEINSTLPGKCILFFIVISFWGGIFAEAKITSPMPGFSNSIAVSKIGVQEYLDCRLSGVITPGDAAVKIDRVKNAKLVNIDDS